MRPTTTRRIGCSVRIEREEGATAQLFIGAGVAEFSAGGEGLAAQDLDPLAPGTGGLITLPGKSYPDSDLAAACAGLILAPPKTADLKQ